MYSSIEIKSILNKTKRRDPWFLDDYTINPYSGCSYNCLFCYTRGTKYGIHLEKKTAIKSNAVEILEKQLANRAKKEQYGIIVLSSSTEPYLHFEEEVQLTRKILGVILKYRFPVHIITRSSLVERDFDLLKQIDKAAILPNDLKSKLSNGTIITFSFSTLDKKIASIFEPGAPSPLLRLETMKSAISEGFLSGVSLMPLLPFISDKAAHLDFMFQAFATAGIHYIFPATITLFGEGAGSNKTMMFAAIKKHYPELLSKYEKWFRHSHQLPQYYRGAFYKKMKAMCSEYGFRDKII